MTQEKADRLKLLGNILLWAAVCAFGIVRACMTVAHIVR